MKLGAVIIGGFVGDGGNETVYLLLNLPSSLLSLFQPYFFVSVFFYSLSFSSSVFLSLPVTVFSKV